MQPNVFLAPRPRNSGEPPSLGQVKHSFPLPGHYHFRFKSPLVPGGDRDKNSVAVWMDCVDERQPCPIWRNSIIVKATRIGVDDDDDDDDDSDFGSREHPVSTTAPTSAAPAPAPRPAAEPVLDIFDGPSPTATHSAPHSAPNSNNLLDVPTSGPQSNSSLLDMHAPSGDSYAGSATSSANDFLGMTAHPTPATPSPQGAQGQPYGGATPGYTQQQPHNPQQQRPPQAPRSGPNAFDSFNNQQGPFGGLQWNN